MEFHLVDERIAGRKPRSLDFAAAAALPLTSITAWEAMFDRLDVAKPVPGAARAILILGGAGGVGSIAIQLARQLTDLTIVATASRPETVQWVKDVGALTMSSITRSRSQRRSPRSVWGRLRSSSRRRRSPVSSPTSLN
jgi:NADPH:quinone reductase-like Zn-dependent oxidoreductase